MKKRDLERLNKVAEVIFLKASARLEVVLAEERRLRHDIDSIRERQAAATAGREGLSAMRHPEIHSAWSLWCARAVSDLNDGLDRLQPEKAKLRDAVRDSFGRHMAVRHLVDIHLGRGRKGRRAGRR